MPMLNHLAERFNFKHFGITLIHDTLFLNPQMTQREFVRAE